MRLLIVFFPIILLADWKKVPFETYLGTSTSTYDCAKIATITIEPIQNNIYYYESLDRYECTDIDGGSSLKKYRLYNVGTCEGFLYLFEDDSLTIIDSECCIGGQFFSTTSNKCECPSDMTWDDSIKECVCTDGKEKVEITSCPPENSLSSSVCMDPCPDGTFRNSGGNCCPVGMVEYCDASVNSWLCRCPYDSIRDSNWTLEKGAEGYSACLKCQNGYPNFDSSECSICVPYYEDTDGNCVNDPCMDNYPFYYPVSDTSSYGFTNDVNGVVTCYDAGDNNDTGVTTGDTGSSYEDNSTTESNTTDGTGITDTNTTESTSTSNITDGITFDDTEILNQLRENKTVSEGIKTSVDNVKTSVDSVKTSVDNLKDSVDEGNQKLDKILSLLDTNVTFSFESLSTQMQTAFTNIQDSIDQVKTNFEQAKAIIEGDKSFTFPSGSFNGFHFTVWDKQIDIDPCPLLIKMRPFLTLLIQSMLVFWSIYIIIWGLRS